MSEKRVSTQIHTRFLDRLVAHRNMKHRGVRHINKHDYYGPQWERVRTQSYFAKHWRDKKWTDSTYILDLRTRG